VAEEPDKSGDNPNDVHISRIVIGSIWGILGIGVTVWSYTAAAGGGRYVIAWGAIAYGLIQVGRGIAGMLGDGEPAATDALPAGDSDADDGPPPDVDPDELPQARALRGAEPQAEPDNRPWRSVRRRELALVIVLGAAILLPGLSSYTLIDPWEGHYGEVARRMLEDDDWVKLQWQNDAYFRSKPGLTFYLMATSMRLHGVASDGGYSGEMVSSDIVVWSLRLPFALFGIFGLVILWYMLARLVSRRVAYIGFGICATIPFYTLVARQAITDMPMVATAMGAIACFLLAVHCGDRELKPLWKRITPYHVFLIVLWLFVGLQLIRYGMDFAADPSVGRGMKVRLLHPAVWATAPYLIGLAVFTVLTWVVWPTRYARQTYMYWAYFLVGVSVLGKGPPGAACVVVVCSLYIVMTGQWYQLLRISLLQGIAILALTAVPWHMAMVLKDGRPWISEYFGHHWFKRAGKGVHGETGTFNFFAQQMGIGMWPWVALLPAAIYSALHRGVARWREDRVRLAMTLWAIGGFAFFAMVETKFHHYVLPAVPAFGVLIAFWADDLLEGKAKHINIALALGVAIILFVARDLIGEQKQLIELFIYRYDRPWPSKEPWNVDVGGYFLWFGLLFAAALACAMVPRIRRYALMAFAGLAVVYSLWVSNGYMSTAAPHWGQGHLHKTYFAERDIHGVDILYYGLRDLSDDWADDSKDGSRELKVRSVLPDDFETGLPMKVHLEVKGQDSYDLNGTVSRLGDDAFWIDVPDSEVAKIAGAIERGRTLEKPKQKKWTQVNADRLIAWQLNWRGENFWQAGEIWGRTRDTQTVFVKTDNKEFLEYIKRPESQGRRFFVVTEAGRADGLKNVLPTATGKQTVKKIDTTCNKFTLLEFTL
jgi:4-amino-4-deoxy-L-arabinose transferase-like glycosyltransferase